ncbi:MAG: hypothetical protein SO238_09505 [Treponema sp.]|nr:hypothetical protein [Treponema sp.]
MNKKVQLWQIFDTEAGEFLTHKLAGSECEVRRVLIKKVPPKTIQNTINTAQQKIQIICQTAQVS